MVKSASTPMLTTAFCKSGEIQVIGRTFSQILPLGNFVRVMRLLYSPENPDKLF